MNARTLILSLRIAALIVILASLGAFISQLRSVTEISGTTILLPFVILTFGGGLGMSLIGIAAVLGHNPKSSSIAATPHLAENQLIDLSIKVDELANTVDRMGHRRADASASDENSPTTEFVGDANERLFALEQQLLALRELVLLPDEQRQERWRRGEAQRRETAIQSASALVRDRRWSDAESAIIEIENDWPSDVTVSAVRKELRLARADAEDEAVEHAQSEIESAMSLSRWDDASALAQNLAADFPTSSTAAKLLSRVEREQGLYTEKTVQRLYEDIRRDIERRVWRRALEHSQTLLEKFPTHARSGLLRKQIKTIGDNAEIEERQEQELRIGELIRARRFQEGVQLSEELLVRFPSSPQAVAIEKMLPKIRQLAAADAEVAARESTSH